MTAQRQAIGVIGAGSWGTALAVLAARGGHEVLLWARSAELAGNLNRQRESRDYLPGVSLPENVSVTSEHAPLRRARTFLIATPAQVLGSVMLGFAGVLEAGSGIVCAKGIERSTSRFMTEVLEKTCPALEPFVLSGPSFATDVAGGRPTAVTLAGRSLTSVRPLAEMLSLSSFRIYASDDMTGVQVGGAVKNVLAIACGIASGKLLGDSARAALTTRAFAELARFGRVLGARPETLVGLSGLGDLILTCASRQSRNYSFGLALGEGKNPRELAASARGVVEGVHTAGVVASMAATHHLDMPVCAAVHRVVEGRSGADEEIVRLLSRPLKAETE